MEKIPFTERLSFGRTQTVVDYPHFLYIQLASFETFAQLDIAPSNRLNQSLHEFFNENFPIVDSKETLRLDFLYYTVETPKYSLK
jgi:DNA-directed RNA polymerase, beta subunit/140 kD subunit